MAKQINWLTEQEAAQKLGYQPRTLRKLVKVGKLDISYTTINDRKYHYSEQDLQKLFFKEAKIIS